MYVAFGKGVTDALNCKKSVHGLLFYFLAATKQLYEWSSPSVRPSHLFDYVPIIEST